MLTYTYQTNTIQITETELNEDVEFQLTIHEPEVHCQNLKKVQQYFDDNKVYTDAMFYTFQDHKYKIVVRKDYYVDFVLTLMKFRLVEAVSWT